MAKYNGTGVVWDVEYNKALARFEDGVFQTDDAGIIDKMNSLGYKDIEEPKAEPAGETISKPAKGKKK